MLEEAEVLRAEVEHHQALESGDLGRVPTSSAIACVRPPAESTAAALLRVLIARLAPEDRRVVVSLADLEQARGTLVISADKADPMASAMVLQLK